MTSCFGLASSCIQKATLHPFTFLVFVDWWPQCPEMSLISDPKQSHLGAKHSPAPTSASFSLVFVWMLFGSPPSFIWVVWPFRDEGNPSDPKTIPFDSLEKDWRGMPVVQ